jgi:hypothetical protein
VPERARKTFKRTSPAFRRKGKKAGSAMPSADSLKEWSSHALPAAWLLLDLHRILSRMFGRQTA